MFLAAIAFSFWLGWTIVVPADLESKEINFTVNKGEGVKEISARLADKGVIRSDYWFRTYVWAREWEGDFQTGEHILKEGMNIIRIARALVSAESRPVERQITTIEGWSNNDIGKYMEEQGIGTKKDFLRLVAKTGWQTKYDFFDDKPLDVDIEGYLFPDTYRVYNDATQEDVVKKMLDNLDKKLTAEMRRDIKKKGMTVHEVLTLASIVELEVRGEKDRQHVADIFLKRLKSGMGLQADSTVNYVTGKSVASASAKDIKVDSPYNTYKYRGLPPGPISNPGMTAITAVIYPESNPYYYFLTTKSGRVLYARTFEEHIKNKAQMDF
jgi:UPF0755 protein